MASDTSPTALPHDVVVSEEENKWLIVGTALNRFVVPNLRKVVKHTMTNLFEHLKSTQGIDQHTFPISFKQHGGIALNYGNINSNSNVDPKSQQKKPKKDWNYKVTSPFDLARLFMHSFMALSARFEESDASCLLGLIIHVDDASCQGTFNGMQKEADDVRLLRNSWGHCHLQEWTKDKYDQSFQQMLDLLNKIPGVPQQELDGLQMAQTEGIKTLTDEKIKEEFINKLLREMNVEGNGDLHQKMKLLIEILIEKEYRNDLIEHHKDITLKQTPYRDTDYIPTIIFVAKNELENHTDRKHYREFIPTHKRQVKQPLVMKELFKKCPDLGETEDPRGILLIGVPGVGKTALCYKLLEDFVKQEISLGEGAAIPFLIKFREVNLIKDRITFPELLFSSGNGPIVRKEHQLVVWNYLMEHERDLVFLLDGCDELHGVGVNYQETIDDVEIIGTAYGREADCFVLLVNLMRGKIFPRARVVVTTRPFCLERIQSLFHRITDLQGLDELGIEKLSKSIFGPQFPKLHSSFMRYLQTNPSLAALCYVPRQAKFLIDHVKYQHSQQEDTVVDESKLPNSMAHLLLLATVNMIVTSDRTHNLTRDTEEHIVLEAKKAMLQTLAELAYKGLFSQRVQQLFTEDDIKELGLSSEDLGTGIMNSYELEGRTRLGRKIHRLLHGFPHLTIQELLASFRLFNMPTEELKKLISECRGEHQMTWLLFFGACGDKTVNQMISYVYPPAEDKQQGIFTNMINIFYPSDKCKGQIYEGKARELLQTLYTSAKQHVTSETSKGEERVLQLFLMHTLNESQQWHLADCLTSALVDWAGMWEIPDTSSPADNTAIVQYLSHVRHERVDIITVCDHIELKLSHTLLTGRCVQGYRGLWWRAGQVTKEIIDEVKEIICEHQDLQYLRIGTYSSSIDEIPCLVTTPNTSIKHLTLSAPNGISPAWMHDNLKQLHNLEALTLAHLKIKGRGQWGYVLQQLQQKTKLKYITMSSCSLDDGALEVLCQLIPTQPLQWLHLSWNQYVHDVSLKRIASCVQRGTCSLTALNVQHCNTTPEGQKILCESLHKYPHMRILGLNAWRMDLVSALLQANTKIEELYLTYISQPWEDMHQGRAVARTEGCLLLPDSTSLTYLHCANINNDGLRNLATTLQHNTTLPCLSLKSYTIKLSGHEVGQLISNCSLRALDLCYVELVDDDHWRIVAQAISNSRTLHSVGVAKHRPFLRGLVKQYPKNGPLRAIYFWESTSERVRVRVQRLQDKLAPTTIQVYYNVRDMPVQSKYKWRTVPHDTRNRLYCDTTLV